jgi:hypothetical protein
LFLGGRRCWLAAVLRGLRLLRGGLLVGVGLLGGCLLGGCFLDGLLLLGLGGGGLLGPFLRLRLGLFLRGRLGLILRGRLGLGGLVEPALRPLDDLIHRGLVRVAVGERRDLLVGQWTEHGDLVRAEP